MCGVGKWPTFDTHYAKETDTRDVVRSWYVMWVGIEHEKVRKWNWDEKL